MNTESEPRQDVGIDGSQTNTKQLMNADVSCFFFLNEERSECQLFPQQSPGPSCLQLEAPLNSYLPTDLFSIGITHSQSCCMLAASDLALFAVVYHALDSFLYGNAKQSYVILVPDLKEKHIFSCILFQI